MKQATISLIKWGVGSGGRELVRIGFTVFGIYIFMTHSAKTPKECDSVLPFINVKTNSSEVFGVILIFSTGLGVALAMNGIEWLIARLKK